MSSTAETLPRSAARAIVAHERGRTGSSKPGIASVAAAADKSATWVRRFLDGDPRAALSWSAGFAIIKAYRELCERIEADAAARRAIALALKAEIDAVLPGNLPMDRGLAHRATPEAAAQKDFSQKSEA